MNTAAPPAMSDEEARFEIRTKWEFAAVVQFLTIFGPALLKLDEIKTEVLEDAFLRPSSNFFLSDLLIQILRNVTDNRFIGEDNWQMYMKRLFEGLPVEDFPYADFENYWGLSPTQKIIGMHQLCEMLLDNPERFRAKLKDPEDQEYWRVDPLGYDSNSNTYWLFDDNRMYIQRPEKTDKSGEGSGDETRSSSPAKKSAKSRRTRASMPDEKPEKVDEEADLPRWEPVCISIEEWRNFPSRFEGSKDRYEKAFYKLLTDDVLPKVLDDLEEIEKQKRLESALNNRKRSNRLVYRELEQMEMDRLAELRRKEQEAAMSSRRDAFSSRREEIERQKAEEEKQRRLLEREERLKKREEQIAKRRHDAELKKAKQESIQLTKERMEKKREGKDKWSFYCYCGVKGKNLDDGQPMLCCERCETWLHIACVEQRLNKKKQAVKDWTTEDYLCSRCIKAEKKALKAAASASSSTSIVDVVGDDGQPSMPPKKTHKIKLILSPRPPSTGASSAPQPVSQKPTAPLPLSQAPAQPPIVQPQVPQMMHQQFPQLPYPYNTYPIHVQQQMYAQMMYASHQQQQLHAQSRVPFARPNNLAPSPQQMLQSPPVQMFQSPPTHNFAGYSPQQQFMRPVALPPQQLAQIGVTHVQTRVAPAVAPSLQSFPQNQTAAIDVPSVAPLKVETKPAQADVKVPISPRPNSPKKEIAPNSPSKLVVVNPLSPVETQEPRSPQKQSPANENGLNHQI